MANELARELQLSPEQLINQAIHDMLHWLVWKNRTLTFGVATNIITLVPNTRTSSFRDDIFHGELLDSWGREVGLLVTSHDYNRTEYPYAAGLNARRNPQQVPYAMSPADAAPFMEVLARVAADEDLYRNASLPSQLPRGWKGLLSSFLLCGLGEER